MFIGQQINLALAAERNIAHLILALVQQNIACCLSLHIKRRNLSRLRFGNLAFTVNNKSSSCSISYFLSVYLVQDQAALLTHTLIHSVQINILRFGINLCTIVQNANAIAQTTNAAANLQRNFIRIKIASVFALRRSPCHISS